MAVEEPVKESTAPIAGSINSAEKVAAVSPASAKEDDDEFPTDWRKIALVMVVLYTAMFIVALVGLINPAYIFPHRMLILQGSNHYWAHDTQHNQ